MKRPDFFLVGAPECGALELAAMLRQHPQVFLPAPAAGTPFDGDSRRADRRALERYAARFARAGRDHKRVGDASEWWLASPEAASALKAFSPRARILIVVRNPLEMLPALHARFVRERTEDLAGFRAALQAEEARQRGWNLPRRAAFPERLLYRQLGRFAAQVELYLNHFGSDHVHVVEHGDLGLDASRVYRDALRFLKIDTGHVARPPGQIARLARWMRGAGQFLLGRNAVALPRSLEPDVRAELEELALAEASRLGELLGRDYSRWWRPTSLALRGAVPPVYLSRSVDFSSHVTGARVD